MPAPTAAANHLLHQRRIALGLSQVELARAAGIGLTACRFAERTGFLSPATAVKLAAVLQVAPAELLAVPARRVYPRGGLLPKVFASAPARRRR